MKQELTVLIIIAVIAFIFLGIIIVYPTAVKEPITYSSSSSIETINSYVETTNSYIDVISSSEEEISQSELEPMFQENVIQIIWDCLKSYGYDDIDCSGIIGNIMREVGGDTFNVNPWLDGCGYGLCQWLGSRKVNLFRLYGNHPSIEEQIEFMHKELIGEDVAREVTEAQYEKFL